MVIFIDKFKIPQNSDLSAYLKRSNNFIAEYKSTHFKTSFFKNLVNDKFEYLGSKPNTLLVQDKKTGKPTELQIVFEKVELTPDLSREDWKLIDEKGYIVGEKHYGLEKRSDNKIHMRPGAMVTMDNRYKGIGTRLDQFQIERALQLGIENIPRTAQPQATYFHAMMGFYPASNRKIPIETSLKETMEKTFNHLDKIDFEPILVEENGQIYLDVNKTLTISNLKKCLDICEKNSKGKIGKIGGVATSLELSGKELQKWKEIIRNHSLLDKIDFSFFDL